MIPLTSIIAIFLSTTLLNLPEGFEDTSILTNLQSPASMAFAPDGRLFFGERISGNVRVAVYNPDLDQWELQPEPFYTFEVPKERHRSSGLRAFAFDPDYENNGWLYIFYMADNPRHNRVVRITADPSNPNKALPESEFTLIELPFNATTSSGSHNGGDMLFGHDGKLYFTTGDGWNGGDDVQSLSTYTGKLFRINSDGSIPEDNPFLDQTTGPFQAIYALGLRNPYTMAINPMNGNIYIHDAVGSKKANIYQIKGDQSSGGANFGHDGFEGIGNLTSVWVDASSAGGKLITGGAWYPENGYWPEPYKGSFFVALWGSNNANDPGQIVQIEPGTNPIVTNFAKDVWLPGGLKPVMTKIGPDENLYYMMTDYETGNAAIRMIHYTGQLTANAPEFNPPPGNYEDPVTITLSSSSPNSQIYFTIDGTPANEHANLYETPITIDATTTLRAVALSPSRLPSAEKTGNYTIGAIPNIAPIADAGPDLTAEVNKTVTLNGSNSYDPDGSSLEISEAWVQLEGPSIEILDADESVANFTPAQTGEYRFQITVTDVDGASSNDETVITVVESIPDVLEGLLARWTMEEGGGSILEDYSPNAFRGFVDGPVYTTETIDNSQYSIRFDGLDDRIDIGNIDLTSNEMSITFWTKIEDFGIHDARFISKASGQQDQDHLWMVSTLDGTKLRFRLKANGNTTTLISDEVLEPNTWYHVAAVYDNQTMRIFLDGKEISSTSKSGSIDSSPTTKVALGNQPEGVSGGDRPFKGWLDEVRIYGIGLSKDQVNTIINAPITTSVSSSFGGTTFRLFPQPIQNTINVRSTKLENRTYEFNLWDVQGRQVKKGTIQFNQGIGQIFLRENNLPDGTYFLRLGSNSNSLKFLLLRNN